jgi:hypothetical protein
VWSQVARPAPGRPRPSRSTAPGRCRGSGALRLVPALGTRPAPPPLLGAATPQAPDSLSVVIFVVAPRALGPIRRRAAAAVAAPPRLRGLLTPAPPRRRARRRRAAHAVVHRIVHGAARLARRRKRRVRTAAHGGALAQAGRRAGVGSRGAARGTRALLLPLRALLLRPRGPLVRAAARLIDASCASRRPRPPREQHCHAVRGRSLQAPEPTPRPGMCRSVGKDSIESRYLNPSFGVVRHPRSSHRH